MKKNLLYIQEKKNIEIRKMFEKSEENHQKKKIIAGFVTKCH